MHPILVLGLLGLWLGACAPGEDQVRFCRELIGAFDPPQQVRIESLRASDEAGYQVRIDYSVAAPGAAPQRHWIACGFAGQGLNVGGRLDLERVATDRQGELGEMALFWLKTWREIDWRFSLRQEAPGAASDLTSPWLPYLYFLQQLVNGTTLACIYGLLAISYTLVYGLIGRINFAFGEVYMIGGVTTALAAGLLGLLGGSASGIALLLVLPATMITAIAAGLASNALVVRPLAQRPTQAFLIATIGLSIGAEETMRLLHGAGDLWIAPDFTDSFVLVAEAGFSVVANRTQLWLLIVTLALFILFDTLLGASRFGRQWRASADDFATAALMGVRIDRVLMGTMALGAAAAGSAGFIIVAYYGVANFLMGFVIGFKALTAAILGGIGSLRGAMLGGVLIALIETLWTAYFPGTYRDVVVFSVLALVLIFRPQGLLGPAR